MPGRTSNGDVFDRCLQLALLLLGFLGAAAREHDDEFVARVADADVVRPDAVAQHARDFAQRLVADVVAVGVVDLLEAVEVHHEQRHFGLQALGARQLAREVHEHEARVRQPGQRVGERVASCVCSKTIELLTTRGRLLGDAIQQPAVVVGVAARLGVIDAPACRCS